MSGPRNGEGLLPTGAEPNPPIDAAPVVPSPAAKTGDALAGRAFRGASWSLIDNMAQQILSLLVFVVLGRILSPALFGIVSTALVFVLLMRSTVLNSISTGLVTLSNPQDEDYDTGFWLCIAIGAFFFALLNLAAGPIADIYKIDGFAPVIRATACIVLIAALSYAHTAWARRNFMFRALAMRNSIGTLIGGSVAIGVALSGYGIAALVINQILASIVGLVLLWRAIPWRPKLRFSVERARPILARALPLGVNQSLQFTAQNFDTAVVTYVLGPVGGGLYAVGKRIVLSIQIALFQPISSVVLPTFAEVATDKERMARAVIRLSGLVMLITGPLFAGLAMVADPAVHLLFGNKWAAAIPVLTILAAFGIALPSLNIMEQALTALGKGHWVLGITLIQMALALTATLLLSNPTPAAIAICLTSPALVALLLTIGGIARLLPLSIGRYLLTVGRPLLCTSLMAVAIRLVPFKFEQPLAELLLLIAVGGITYVIAALLLARDSVGEIFGLTASIIPRRLRSRLGFA